MFVLDVSVNPANRTLSEPGKNKSVPGVRQGGGTAAVSRHLPAVRLSERRRNWSKHLAQPVDQRRLKKPDQGEC